MRINAEVIAVKTIGDHLRVRLQGEAESDPKWSSGMGVFSLDLPTNKSIARAYFVGRKVRIEIEPKP